MQYQKFKEYLSHNKKLQTSAPVKVIADFEGKVDAKPKKEEKHKDAGGKGQTGDAKPYKGGSDAADPNKKMGDGFAHKGDKKLKYNPKLDKPSKEGGKTTVTWPKTKTQEWIDKTKGMSLSEFTKTIRTENLKGIETSDPQKAIKETVSICKSNKKHISTLVREAKRGNLIGQLVKELAEHPETFKALTKLMTKDESYAKKLAKAMNEMVSPPVGMEDAPPMLKKKSLNMGNPLEKNDMDMEDEDDMMGDDMGDEENMDDMEGDEDEMGDEENMDDMEGDEMDDMDDMGDETEDDMMGDEDMGDMGDEDMEDMPPPMPPKKSAHGNLMNAMKNHPALNM